MSLKLYNSLTGNLEIFSPLKEGAVRIYTCGPTVYDVPHVGNYRAFLFFDLVKRYLRFLGYDVTHVMNITDVDDKIIARCARESLSLDALTSKFSDAFKADSEALGIELPEILPKATDHIGEMIDLIKSLIDKKHAYVTADGSVFFKIGSFKMTNTGKRILRTSLSGKNGKRRTGISVGNHLGGAAVRDGTSNVPPCR